MARHNFDYNADDLQGKIYDKDLFKRLVRYLRPYLNYVIISFILLIILASCTWIIPVITKTIVDRYIVSNRNMIEFSSTQQADEIIKEIPRVDFEQFDRYLLYQGNKEKFFTSEQIERFKQSANWWKDIVLINNSALDILPDSLQTIKLNTDRSAIFRTSFIKLQKSKDFSNDDLSRLREDDINNIKHYGIIYLIVITIQLFASFFQVYFINIAAQHAMFDLRIDLFGHLEKMPTSFFDKNPVGRLVTRVTNDVRTLDEMLANGLIQIIQDIIVVVGITVTMFILSWQLALVCMIIVPIVIFLLKIFRDKVRVVYREVRKRTAIINATLSEDISGMKIIKLFNLQSRKQTQFKERNDKFLDASLNELSLYATFRPLIWSFSRLSVAIILWYGGGLILKGIITLGIFMAFLRYMERFFNPINSIAERFNILQAAMSGAERIFDLMDQPVEEDNIEISSEKLELEGKIDFQNVWMAYNEEDWILKDVSFSINPGEKIALVGHTGSGKTTIVSLLSRLYPIQKGEILIDDKPITSLPMKAVRSQIGIVQQDVFLFSGTIKDNIRLNNSSISTERLQQVAKMVNVQKFIDGLPQKFDEPVMERGSTFSVGQRQLLAFARVLTYDPAIFILDEATSNIDTETEILIQDALEKVMANRTSLIIAHRLSTIKHADRIIVLHKGKIMETGSHDELIAKQGFYYDLYRLQYDR
ncbi:MAG: ABC transporter ATP-binding protein/permease [Candidatus Cloacimonetes bacterium]|nr:ABC transporter ATP-binding protein/permease [Candidatus Cloacimonadota bacterium]